MDFEIIRDRLDVLVNSNRISELKGALSMLTWWTLRNI